MPRSYAPPRPEALAAPSGAVALALGALVLAAGPSAAVDLGPLTKIAGPSPLLGCIADKIASHPGTAYPNTAVEPWVAANPANPNDLIVVWQQDRWSNGGSRGTMAGVSTDGGATWRGSIPPAVTRCTGGTWRRASDPWADVAPDGTAYLLSLAADGPTNYLGPIAMLVRRSTDRGASWGAPVTLIRDTSPEFTDDKGSVTADPADPNLVYATWDRRRRLAAGSEGPAYFARTTTGGQSWEPARAIYDPGANSRTYGNQIVVQPSGRLVDFFLQTGGGPRRIGLLRSSDKGASFEAAPAFAAAIESARILTTDARSPVRGAEAPFDVAVDPADGRLYLVWQDARFRGVPEVAFSMSADGGTTWSSPVRIDRTPASANALRQQAFIPSVEVGPGGVLVATYYDFRNDTSGSGELTDYWAVFCDPGRADCREAAGWGGELRLTSASFDMLDAPLARGHFLGDYMGLRRAGRAVYAVFGVAAGRNHTDLYGRKVTFGDATASPH